MSGFPDDARDDYDDRDQRDDRDPDRRGGGDEQTVARARAQVGAPGVFLILNGLLGLVVAAVLFVPMVLQPEMIIKVARDMVVQQPPGPDRQRSEQQLDDAEKQIQQNKTATQIQNAIQLGLVAVASLLAAVGGFAMRSLGNYGLSITGAVVSIIPCLTGCCCTGLPFGVWALVVLVRPEVKAGYAAKRRLAAAPSDRY